MTPERVRRRLDAMLGRLVAETIGDVAGVLADQLAADDDEHAGIVVEAREAMQDALIAVARRRGWEGR